MDAGNPAEIVIYPSNTADNSATMQVMPRQGPIYLKIGADKSGGKAPHRRADLVLRTAIQEYLNAAADNLSAHGIAQCANSIAELANLAFEFADRHYLREESDYLAGGA